MPHPEQGARRPASLTQAEQSGNPRRGVSSFVQKLLPTTPSVLSERPFLAFLAYPVTRSFADQSPQDQGKERTIPFAEYNGWPNRPTWDVYMVMTSYYDTYQAIERIADEQTPEAVRKFVTGEVSTWKQGRYTPHQEAARILVQDFLMNGVQRVEWTPVYDTLRGKREAVGEQNELTTLAYTLLAQTDWQAIVQDAKYLTQADDLLRGWLEDQCITWIESPEARQYTGSVGQFANTVLHLYFDAVNWEEVASALRGE